MRIPNNSFENTGYIFGKKLPAITVGLTSAGVWKDVLQDSASEEQLILPEIEDINER